MLERQSFGSCELYLGDSKDLFDDIGTFDVVVTDPPYGIGERTGTISKARNKNAYESFDDSPENWVRDIKPIVTKICSFRAVITPGPRMLWHYPPASDMGMIFQPAACGMSKWGRTTCQPVLFYGLDPMRGKDMRPLHYQTTEKSSCSDHPCSKPQGVSDWMVWRGSIEGETVIDPFMGTGTTGVSCVKIGRRFIGIERERKYFDLACKRIESAIKSPDLFIAPPKKTKTERFL